MSNDRHCCPRMAWGDDTHDPGCPREPGPSADELADLVDHALADPGQIIPRDGIRAWIDSITTPPITRKRKKGPT